jgi:hypothetical protein
MDGLQKIIQLRGGMETLQSSYDLQVVAFW